MIRYAYELYDFRRWAGGLSQLLQISPATARTGISPEKGSGYFRAGRLNDSISYVVLDLALEDDLTLIRQRSPRPGLILLFDLGTGHPALRLSSTGYEQEMIWPRQIRIKTTGIFIPDDFLSRYVRPGIRSELFRLTQAAPHTYTEPIPFEYRPLIEDVFQADPASPLYHLLLHNRLLLLTEKFLFSFVNRTPQQHPLSINWTKAKEKDLEALRNVMRLLSDTRLNKFPSIESLSRTAMMSSTKLKTRFKQIYGMKLYEFYNHRRLLMAKEMLKTGNYSVKQVGVNIGFSNLSNFAKAFKKTFGVLPREILKSK